MNTYENMQALKEFVIEHALPKSDVALFGVNCPYCGKSDRIRNLEAPPDLPGRLDPNGLKTYTELWGNLRLSEGSLGVCKFCHNLLEVIPGKSEAEAICSDGSEEDKP